MLTDDEFDEWCESNRLSDEAVAVIKHVRASEPARRVQSRIGNVIGNFNRSRSMPYSMQAESRTVELPAILMKEMLDPDFRENWPQPPSFVVTYQNSAGKNRGYVYTADFFVINKNSAGWEQWKKEAELLRLAEEYPERYYFGDDGRWHFAPGERYAEQYGLYFHVHSSKEISPVVHRNLNLLLPFYTHSGKVSTDTPLFKSILSTVTEKPGITLATLLEEIEEASNNDIFELFLTRQIYIDLSLAFLGNDDEVLLFTDKTVADFFTHLSETQCKPANQALRVRDLIPNTSILLDGEPVEIFHIGKTEVTLKTGADDYPTVSIREFERWLRDGKVTGYTLRPQIDPELKAYRLAAKRRLTKVQMITILEKEEIVKRILSGERVTDDDNEARKHRYWVTHYVKAKAKYGNGLIGLMPGRRGNRTDRLTLIHPELRAWTIEFIKEKVETVTDITKSTLYGLYRLFCREKGVDPPSRKTFMKVFHSRKGAEQTEKMEGSKAAYQQEEPIDDEHYTTPVHGDRAWEIAHLDHTLMDVALIDSEKSDVFHGRAWLTLLICAFSRRILAHYISFDKPSRVSCMGVIRDCVRRWRRLPEIIYVDQGKEFWSIYFQTLLAHFHCDVRWRPATKPRFGAIIERFFHTLNKQFFHNLLGNTKIMKKVRQVTKAVNPENLAVWDLPMLDEHLERYLYEEYDNRVHSSLSRSPRAEFEASLKKFNAPPACDIEYDEEFLLETMISTGKETRMVKRGRGVTVFGTWYRSKKLRNTALYDTQVPVNIDPFDASHVYAYVGGQWEECFAPPKVFALLKGKSVGLMHTISEEVRQRGKARGVRCNTHFEELALDYSKHEEGEKVKKRRMQDEELAKIAQAKSHSVSTATHNTPNLGEEAGDVPDNVIEFEELKTYKKMRRG